MTRLFRRSLRAVAFIAYYLRELVIANVQVAAVVVAPGYAQRPGIVRMPTRARRDIEITLLANAISFTPGTLTLEVAEDGQTLFVHVLVTESPDHARGRLRTLEDRLLEVFE